MWQYYVHRECAILCALFMDILRETVRTQLIEGVTLPRSSFSSRAKKKYRCLCDVCARAKIHRASFPASRESNRYTVPGQYVI